MSLSIALLCVSGLLGAVAVAAEPRITESEPVDGEILPQPPEVIHLCFSEPVDTERPGWKIDVASPDGLSLGLRIVFEPSGDCVDIFPGEVPGAAAGVWTFDWLVTSQASREEASGTINFEVDPEAGAAGDPEPASDDGGSNNDALLIISVVVIGVLVVVAGAASLLRMLRGRDKIG